MPTPRLFGWLALLVLIGCGTAAPRPASEPTTRARSVPSPTDYDAARIEAAALLPSFSGHAFHLPAPPGASEEVRRAFHEVALVEALERVEIARAALAADAVRLADQEAELVRAVAAEGWVRGALQAAPFGTRTDLAHRVFRLGVEAVDDYDACAASAGPWVATCRDRREETLALLRAHREPEPPPPPSGPFGLPMVIPVTDPDAPTPDLTRARELALVLTEELVADPHAAILLTAVRQRLVALGLTLIDPSEIDRAIRVRDSGRRAETGPTCAQPVPLPLILSETHPHLVVVEIFVQCGTAYGCSLFTSFNLIGTYDDRTDPTLVGLEAPFPTPATPASIVAAASALAPPRHRIRPHTGRAVTTLGAYSILADPIEALLGIDPLRDSSELAACRQAGSGLQFDVAVGVQADGSVDVVRATASEVETAEAQRASACIERVVGAAAFRCTQTGLREEIAFRLSYSE